MSYSVGQNYGGSPYPLAGLNPNMADSPEEVEAKQISKKQKRDTLDNAWLGAQMKNVNEQVRNSKGN